MELKECIYKRKSIRKYKKELVDSNAIIQIENFITKIKPLYNDIKVKMEIIDKENIKSVLPWITQKVITIHSEEKDGYLENAGFMFQQLDLYLQSIGLGSCWIGMGKLDPKVVNSDGLKFVIFMTFGYPDEDMYRNKNEYKRMELSKIVDIEDYRLECARYAPSSVNNQPWYFTHESDYFNIYCADVNIFYKRFSKELVLIDCGIALAHLYIENIDSFNYFKVNERKVIKGYSYLGSFKI